MRKLILDRETITIENNLAEIQRVAQMIRGFVNRNHLPVKLITDFLLASDELLTNIVSYGYEDTETHHIHLQFKLEDNALSLSIEDDGRAYNPLKAITPNLTLALQDRQIGGLGIHLVRKLMDHIEYRRKANKNLLILKKKVHDLKGNESDGMV